MIGESYEKRKRMAHDNRDIAQEAAADFLSKEIWEIADKVYAKNKYNEFYLVKMSKRDPKHRIVRTYIATFPYKKGVIEEIKEALGFMGSMCLHVKRSPKEIKHVWNLPFEKRGGIIVPDGRTSRLVLESVAQIKGRKCTRPDVYASLGKNA